MPAVSEAPSVGIERQDGRNGAFAYALDTAKQVALPFQAGVVVDMILDGLYQAVYFLVQPIEMSLDIAAHGFAGHAQAIAFLGVHGLQGHQAQHQGAQGQLGLAGGLPRGRVAFSTEVGNEPGIHLACFGAGQPGLAVRLDLGRIDHADRETLGG